MPGRAKKDTYRTCDLCKFLVLGKSTRFKCTFDHSVLDGPEKQLSDTCTKWVGKTDDITRKVAILEGR